MLSSFNLFREARALVDYWKLPSAAKKEHRRDRQGLPKNDIGIEPAIREGMSWLCRAQDRSASQDGGVARHFSLIDGWATSYPETTGYIIPTMFEYAKTYHDESMRMRAKKMLDWLVSIQFPEGGFQGGMIDSEPVVPVKIGRAHV